MSAHLKAVGDYAALLEQYDTWMFDCDGVLWSGDFVIDGAVEVLQVLRKYSKFRDVTFTIPCSDPTRKNPHFCDQQCDPISRNDQGKV
jgi:4-nitrophenyl phosphatase